MLTEQGACEICKLTEQRIEEIGLLRKPFFGVRVGAVLITPWGIGAYASTRSGLLVESRKPILVRLQSFSVFNPPNPNPRFLI